MECYRDGCDMDAKTAGLCSKHYSRVRRGTEGKARLYRWRDEFGNRLICGQLECGGFVHARGLCKRHYSRLQKGLPLDRKNKINTKEDGSRKECENPECERVVFTNGLCSPHYYQDYALRTGTGPKPLTYCPVDGCGRIKAYRSVICKRCNQFRWRFSLTVEATIQSWKYGNRHCSNPGCLSKESLHMDHDHDCCPPGKFPQSSKVSCGECVRGWLCHPCNMSLGQMQEDPRRIEGLLRYLNGERG